jgi:CBS domain-containing protein
MNPDPVTVTRDVDLETLAEDYVLRRNARGLLVVEDGKLLGIVTTTDLRKVPREQWSQRRAGDVMTPADRLRYLELDAPVSKAIELMLEGDFHQMPVMSDGRLVGLLSRFELMRYFQTRSELGLGR